MIIKNGKKHLENGCFFFNLQVIIISVMLWINLKNI